MVQSATLLLQAYQLTHDSFYVGMIGLVRVVPLLIFSLFGGVIADHYDRRNVLIITQISMLLITLTLGILTMAGVMTIGILYLMVAIMAMARAFNNPARQAMMANLVPAEDFPNAASINGIIWKFSDVLGPIIAGLLISLNHIGPINGYAACYILDAVSFLAVLVSLAFLPPRPSERAKKSTSAAEVLGAIYEGFKFIRRAPVLRNAMFIDFWATLCAGAEALLPAFAHNLPGPAEGASIRYGLLAACTGTGALVAATSMAWMPVIKKQGFWVIAMIAIYGLATIGFGISPTLFTAGIFLAATGASDMISTVLRQTIRQLATPDNMRGRMSSIGMIFQISGPQMGDFEAGALSRLTGERAAIVVGGFMALLVSGWWGKGSPLKGYVHGDPALTDSPS